MQKNSDFLAKIDKKIAEYFPQNWTQKDIETHTGEKEEKGAYVLDISALNSNLNIPIRDFVLRGGKRIRPILFLTCMEIFGKKADDFLDFAVFLELVHNATLIIDDIEDEGTLRRGKPTCHVKFGLDTAANAGVALHTLPLSILFSKKIKIPAKLRLKLLEIYKEELACVSMGQAMDIYWPKNLKRSLSSVTEKKYMGMVSLKTGSLMRMSTRFACALSGKRKEERLFSVFAQNLGMAFQIIDDCLDLALESNKKFGKIFGNDISDGKVTLPVLYTLLGKISEEEKKEFTKILGSKERNRKKILEAVLVMEKSGAIKKARDKANSLIDNSLLALEKGYSGKGDLELLRRLAYFAVKRQN